MESITLIDPGRADSIRRQWTWVKLIPIARDRRSIGPRCELGRRLFIISVFPFATSERKRTSSHQQDLPNTTFFRSGLSFGCVAEWQLPADRDHQFAVSDSFGHKPESLCIRFCDHVHHLYRWVLVG